MYYTIKKASCNIKLQEAQIKLVLGYCSKTALLVADVPVTRTKNDIVSTVQEAEELVTALVEIASNHLDLGCRGQTRADVVLASDSRDWLNVCVVCIHRSTYSYEKNISQQKF